MRKKKHCKWYTDEFCTNDQSPCVADYCPVVEYPELCKCREDDTDIDVGMSDVKKAVMYMSRMGEKFPYIDNGHTKVMSFSNIIDLIHRLQGEIAGLQKQIETQRKIIEYQDSVEERNAELQKQVDELTAFKNEAISLSLYGKGRKDGEEVAVKDTAKEILEMADKINKGGQNDLCEFEVAIKERYGVEVE